MLIQQLKLTNFRNHKQLEMNCGEINLIYGANTSGKTSVLEAIDLLAGNASFKATVNKEVICWGKDFARIEGVLPNKTTLEVFFSGTSFRSASYKVNKASKSKGNFGKNLQTVLFSHQDLTLLEGSPAKRRQFLDRQLKHKVEYQTAITNYTKALKHRNRLLEQIKEGIQNRSALPYWNIKLVEQAKIIETIREQYFSYLKKQTPEYTKRFRNLFGIKEIDIHYHKKEISRESLERDEEREINAKQTLRGPHRADFEILWQTKNLGRYGSRGQQRAMITILKMIQTDYLFQETGQKPIILLDDVFSELDATSIKAVKETIADKQVFITSADEGLFGNGGKNMFPDRPVLFFSLPPRNY